MKLNTNNNVYTILYAAIMVVIVAFLLAFVSQALKERQDKNVQLDTQKQILYALNIRGLDDEQAENKYKEVVLAAENVDGQTYYRCSVNNQTKYVLPLKGMGLWGGISGYLAINEDKQTIFGAYFSHESETAGLGAEIKDSQEWQEKFQGKQIFDADGNIILAVVKKVDNPEAQVDAVTGATLTSNGVNDMLKAGIEKYLKLLKEE